MIRIGGDETVEELQPTTISDQDYEEDDLREWILHKPQSILGEDLRLIGREVAVQDIRDAIDLLAIDRDGNILVIELKQGRIQGDVDFQSLKYAAYTSYWDYGELRDQFEKFKSTPWGNELYDGDTTLRDTLDEFCNEDYTVNEDQRLMLVGESCSQRLDLVARWLSDRDIQISIIEIQLLDDDGKLYLDAEQTIPVPDQTPAGVKPDTSDEPWKSDGKDWHLHEVVNDETAELLEEVVAALGDIERLDGPHWGQKQYLSFKQDRKNRVLARTQKTLFNVEIYDVPTEDVELEALADELGVDRDDVQADSEDLRSGRPGVRITCRGGVQLDTGVLTETTRELLATADSV